MQAAMKPLRTATFWLAGIMLAMAALGPSGAAQAADKVKVGVFPVSSSLPYFIARDLGYFQELNIEPEMITLMGGPPVVAAHAQAARGGVRAPDALAVRALIR